MFKKINSTVLVVILIALVGIYYATRLFDSSDRSFREVVADVNPDEVTRVVINDPQSAEIIDIRKEGDRWSVHKPSGNFPADSNVVANIIAQVGNLKTKRYAGKGEDQWKKYELTDSTATTVEFMSGGETLTKLMIGKFSYSMPKDQVQQQQQQMMGGRQPQGEMTSYVRLADEKDVYAVDGFLKMNFNRDADSYRDKTLVNVNPEDIQRVVLDYGGRTMTLTRGEPGWMLNGTPADSAGAVNYIRGIARLSNPGFLPDDYSGQPAAYKVNIEGNNFAPIELRAYPVSDTNINYVVNSSHNPTAYFSGKQSDLFEKIFVEEADLMPQ